MTPDEPDGGSMTEPKPVAQYAQRDAMELGVSYIRHVEAMTAEALHSKSDIAAELAYRDNAIAALQAQIAERDAAIEKLRAALNDLLARSGPAGDITALLKNYHPDAYLVARKEQP